MLVAPLLEPWGHLLRPDALPESALAGSGGGLQLQVLLVVTVPKPLVGVNVTFREQLLIEKPSIRQFDVRQQPPIAISTARSLIKIDAHLLAQNQPPGKRRGFFGEVHPVILACAHLGRIDAQESHLGGIASLIRGGQVQRVAIDNLDDPKRPTLVTGRVGRDGLLS